MNKEKIKTALEKTFKTAVDVIHHNYTEWGEARKTIESINQICDFNEFTRDFHNPDDCLEFMENIDEFGWKPTEVLQRAFFGYAYNPYYKDDGTMKREPFNPNHEYFTFNGYGNLMSVDERDWHAYWELILDLDDYVEYAEEQGVLDEIAEILGVDED